MRKLLSAIAAGLAFSILLPVIIYGFSEWSSIPLVAALSLPLFILFGIPASIFIEKRNPRNGIIKFLLYIVAGMALGLIGHLLFQMFDTDFGSFHTDFSWFLIYGVFAGIVYYAVTLIIRPKTY
ncbi:hypothetical protein [Bacillus sp. 1P06AnD]|uniref:hypothetical protein n=1 Tax=Bacillus sp. 1P06AnD TaxID=3132208 RepID=UPI0039A2BB4C